MPLLIPSPSVPRVFGEAQWDTDRCLREFGTALRNQDSEAAMVCMRALDRLGCWHEAFKQLIAGMTDVSGASLLWFWITHGLHISDSMQGDPILAEALKALLPPYAGHGHTLYRGEALDRYQRRNFGMSWTTEIDVARMFARRREPAGVVLKLEASPMMIFSGPSAHSEYLGESEYLLDPTAIAAVDVVGD